MADVDIDPLGDHYKPDKHLDETSKTIPFTLGGVIEGGSTLEPGKETSFRGGILSQPDSENHLVKCCIICYPKKQVKPQKYSILTISNSERETVLQKQE